MKSTLQAKNKSEIENSSPNASKNNSNKELPAKLKIGVEALSGVDMSDTTVHKNSSLPAQFKAQAFAEGTNIHLAPGKEEHLAHEAWHVAQQKQGRVEPTKQLKGKTNINDDPTLEKEADTMGAKALTIGENPIKQLKSKTSNSSSTIIQREKEVSTLESIPEVEEEEEEEVVDSISDKKEGEAEGEEMENPKDVDLDDTKKAKLSDQVSSGKTLVNSIKSFVKSLTKEPESVGESLVSKSTGVLGKFQEAVNIISFLGKPFKNMAVALLSVKTKWAQWNVFGKAAENGVPEAIYALGKVIKGFAGGIAKFLWNTFKFVSRILFFIPAVTAVAASLIIFQGAADAFGKVAASAKGVWQKLKGEKKDKFSKKLLERAMRGDKDALQLIFDLKLGSVMGSDFWIVNKVTILKNEITSKDNLLSHAPDSIKDKVGPLDRRELIFNSDKGPPSSAEELHERLIAISGSANSKKVIQDEIKSTMTGFGK
tara:strand:+ start:3314 stop:4765 length:1452 start_codon:yes stop_codon:yes gene_type:complete